MQTSIDKMAKMKPHNMQTKHWDTVCYRGLINRLHFELRADVSESKRRTFLFSKAFNLILLIYILYSIQLIFSYSLIILC